MNISHFIASIAVPAPVPAPPINDAGGRWGAVGDGGTNSSLKKKNKEGK